jgi:hypothetical protein
MSDDTPTEKFDPRKDGANPPDQPPTTPIEPNGVSPVSADDSEYAPTRRMPAQDLPPARDDPAHWPPVDSTPTVRTTPPPAAPRSSTSTTTSTSTKKPDESKKKHTLMWWLIGIGAALLIALIVLLITLFGGADEPAVAPTPTESSAAPEPEPTPSNEPEPEPTQTVAPPVTSPTFATFSAPANAACEEGEDEAPLTFSWSSSDATTAYIGVGTQNAALNPTFSDLPPTATFEELNYDCSVASEVYTVTLEDSQGRLASNTVTVTAR